MIDAMLTLLPMFVFLFLPLMIPVFAVAIGALRDALAG
jgi:hypothetical protein